MKVIDHLDQAKRPLISFEIIPPLRGGDFKSLMQLIEDLVAHRPPFIDITSHSAVVSYEEHGDGIRRVVKRKRPGTLGVCALIQNKYNVDAVPHVICRGFTREETEDFMIELRYLGIDNVLAIRGDDSGYSKPIAAGRTANRHASELIAQIHDMNQGHYLEEITNADPTAFCVGAAGYPEKHFEAPNLPSCIKRVKEKVDSGAEYIVTQMFFDNAHYFRFVEQCRAEGITVPIIPGLKVLTSAKQLSRIPRTFHCDIPSALAENIEAAPDRQGVIEVGVDWAVKQTEELINRGVPSVHFYVMQKSSTINRVMEKLKLD